ncbi:MAG: hypothetical protein IT175_15070 [Acidobacteria bacterium]|nr:hypothetical protein [Acidobacteriota bacterium]
MTRRLGRRARTPAADLLGIDLSNLYRKLRRHEREPGAVERDL